MQASSAITEQVRRPTWLQLHGSEDWDGLLYPLVDPSLRAQILNYVLFSQATYDAYDDADPASRTVPYSPASFFDKLGLGGCGYEVTRYLFATMSELPRPPTLALKVLPRLNRQLKRLLRLDTWSEDTNWMGYVAVSDDEESWRRLDGRRNILVAWRGTRKPSEWFKDAQWRLERLDKIAGSGGAMVEHGFRSIYTSRSRRGRFTKSSASEQVKAEIRRLVEAYGKEGGGKGVTLTVTGHSLGGALALLSAGDAAASIPGLDHVSVVSFGGPQVGDAAFVKELADNGVKVLRVVNKEDEVPKLPRLVDCRYQHAGVELELAVGGRTRGRSKRKRLRNAVHAKKRGDSAHSLKTYRQLLQPAEETPASTTTSVS